MSGLIMSPSLFKGWTKCPRLALIDSYRFLGNIHTVYGRAYEHGSRLLIEMMSDYKDKKGEIYTKVTKEYEYPESEDRARELIVGYALLESSKYLIKFSLEQHKEKNVFTLAIGLQHTYAFFDEFLTRERVDQYEERIVFKAPNFTIGGAYDLKAKSTLNGTSALYDFKGITSLWNYSFTSSPQLPIYTVLKQMALIAQGKDEAMSMNGGYLINMTSAKKGDDPFLYIPVNTKLVLNNLGNMMGEFIKAGKELNTLLTKNQSLLLQYYNAGVGLDNCSSGFNCFQLGECESGNFAINTFPDDRVFDNKIEMTFSQSLMESAIKKIQANSSKTNLVNGDGIMTGEEIGEDAINSFFDVDNIDLSDL